MAMVHTYVFFFGLQVTQCLKRKQENKEEKKKEKKSGGISNSKRFVILTVKRSNLS